MRDNSCVFILILAEKKLELLDRTIKSILAQADLSRLRVVVMDNASPKDTYRKLLDYEIQYPQLISVIREKKPTTKGRQLKDIFQHLRFTRVDYSMIMEPGDTIHPEFMQQGMRMLRLLNNARCIVFEAGLWDGTKEIRQQPIYQTDCILNASCKCEYTSRGIGHKVQVLYRSLPIGLTMKLPYFSVLAEQCSEWFSLILNQENSIIYRKDAYGCVCGQESFDVMDLLIKKAFYIKRNFYAIETGVFSSKHAADIQNVEVISAYRCLALTALKYAAAKIRQQSWKDAEDCLLFAEMIDLDIVDEEEYKFAAECIASQGGHAEALGQAEQLEQMLMQDSTEPPAGSFEF